VEATTGTVPYCMACIWISPQGSKRDGTSMKSAPSGCAQSGWVRACQPHLERTHIAGCIGSARTPRDGSYGARAWAACSAGRQMRAVTKALSVACTCCDEVGQRGRELDHALGIGEILVNAAHRRLQTLRTENWGMKAIVAPGGDQDGKLHQHQVNGAQPASHAKMLDRPPCRRTSCDGSLCRTWPTAGRFIPR